MTVYEFKIGSGMLVLYSLRMEFTCFNAQNGIYIWLPSFVYIFIFKLTSSEGGEGVWSKTRLYYMGSMRCSQPQFLNFSLCTLVNDLFDFYKMCNFSKILITF